MCSLPSSPSAWHARGWPHPRRLTVVALLASAATGLCAAPARGQGNGEPVYETVVTAPPAREAPREDRAAASTVITTERTPRAAESVTQLLAEQAGGAVTRLGGLGATATLSLRGSTANQVLVYVDSLPLNTATGGGVDLGALPLGDIERIEIYRGTSPIAFGASAIGGVVSLTTAVPKQNLAAFELGAGSFGTYYGSARAAWNRGRLHVYTGAHLLTSEGDFPYVNTSGTDPTSSDDEKSIRRNNDLRQVDGLLRAEVELAPGRRLRASAMVFEREQGLPGPGTLRTPIARLGTFRASGSAAYESKGDLGPASHVRATAYGNYQLTHFDDPGYQINAKPTDAFDRTYTAGGTLDWRQPLRPWLSLAFVLDGRYDRFVPSDASLTGYPGTRLAGAAGWEGDLWLSPLRLDVIASLRLEAARESTSGRDNFGDLVATKDAVHHVLPIARLSLVEKLTAWLSLRFNAGRYARLPSLIELYGNTGYLMGNTDLLPERGLNADLGPVLSWRQEAREISWSTAVFASWVSDLISYRMGGGRARAENIGSARILGIESSATVSLGPARIVASATYTEALDTTSRPESRPEYLDKQLPLRPRYRLYARPEWRAIALPPSLVVGLYAEADATAGNYVDSSNLRSVRARLLFGAGLFASLPGSLCLRLSARNLANAHVYDVIDYPLPGREIYLTFGWSSPTPTTKE